MVTILTPRVGGMAKIKRVKGKGSRGKGMKKLDTGLNVFSFYLSPFPLSHTV
jgi:hypothetical protein